MAFVPFPPSASVLERGISAKLTTAQYPHDWQFNPSTLNLWSDAWKQYILMWPKDKLKLC